MVITKEEFEIRLKNKNPNLHLIGEYFGYQKETDFYCDICNGIFSSKPINRVINGCPICSRQLISNPPEYINSIWSSQYREYGSRYMSEEQMKSYQPKSDKKIEIICPDCGNKRIISIKHLFNDGFNCSCGDCISYPNKFIYELIKQLNISFIPEYKPSWSGNKRYDLYIKSHNLIIENHGMQHYSECTGNFSSKSLEEQQCNDKIKKNVALSKGISFYVELDCRYSNMEWIKNSVMTSDLPFILGFVEKDIDWNKCLMATTKNIIKESAKLWESGKTTMQIANIYNLDKSIIIKYLKNASLIGWCNYSPEEAMKRKGLMFNGVNHQNAIKVYCCEEHKVFGCIEQGKIFCKGYKNPNISASCNGTYETIGGYHWKYLYDKIKKDGTVIPGAITLGLITEEEALKQLSSIDKD